MNTGGKQVKKKLTALLLSVVVLLGFNPYHAYALGLSNRIPNDGMIVAALGPGTSQTWHMNPGQGHRLLVLGGAEIQVIGALLHSEDWLDGVEEVEVVVRMTDIFSNNIDDGRGNPIRYNSTRALTLPSGAFTHVFVRVPEGPGLGFSVQHGAFDRGYIEIFHILNGERTTRDPLASRPIYISRERLGLS